MNVSDIPQEMLQKIRMHFEATPEVRQLRTKQQYEQRKGNFAEALKIAQHLESLFSDVLYQYMEKAECEVMTFDTETASIPRKDKDEMMEMILVLFMACDIIDSAAINLNDILKRSKPDIRINTFDDIQKISDMARRKLEYLQKKGDYMKDLVWAETCDNMYDMICNKARSIMRRRKESKNWGENKERLERGPGTVTDGNSAGGKGDR